MKLEVKDLYKSFGGTEVLHGISFSVESGRALGLLGRNGAGKTTTIRILMQVFAANKGTVTLDGVPFSTKKIGIGYLPEERGTGVDQMVFNTGAALLDAIVLAVVSEEKEGTYGYKITQEVRAVLDVSESTLYPVLRRLLKDGCLEVYDMEYGGRNRRYYKITESGRRQLNLYITEWKEYSERITSIFTGRKKP